MPNNPYADEEVVSYEEEETTEPATTQSVMIVCQRKRKDTIIAEISEWYDQRNDVTLLRHGTTSIGGKRLAFIIVEFDEGEPDKWFIQRLRKIQPPVEWYILRSELEPEEEE